jgi:tungstate/molybdate transport system ATP-binding protein
MLRVEGVCKKFQDFSLNQISFTVDQGDYFMLLGPSGAGKSLILETIAGLHKPDSGKIFFQVSILPILGLGREILELCITIMPFFPTLQFTVHCLSASRKV